MARLGDDRRREARSRGVSGRRSSRPGRLAAAMKRTALLAAALVAGAALPASSAAPRHGWTTHGPDGGLVSPLEIDPASPKIVYAGTGGAGVFRSTNGGRTWHRRSNGLPANAEIGALEL